MERGAESGALAAQLRKKRVLDSNFLALQFASLFKLTLIHTRLSKMVRIQIMLSDKLKAFPRRPRHRGLQGLIGGATRKVAFFFCLRLKVSDFGSAPVRAAKSEIESGVVTDIVCATNSGASATERSRRKEKITRFFSRISHRSLPQSNPLIILLTRKISCLAVPRLRDGH